MKVSICVIATILLRCIVETCAADQLPWQQEFVPPNGKGRVVVVVSGRSGPGNYAYYAKDVAAQGYYTVLVNGNDFWERGGDGGPLLKGVITHAQQSPHALRGKVAVIGFSLGGAVCLTYATRMPELVSAVVTYYPATDFITKPEAFVSKMRVPTLMFAGVLDTYLNCCLIETARELADAAKTRRDNVILKLIEYPDAAHGWAIKDTKGWRENDTADAFRRTLDHLRQNSGT
jgi:dipeptidyl aminopeptidase/acylaminoacyl peptidase